MSNLSGVELSFTSQSTEFVMCRCNRCDSSRKNLRVPAFVTLNDKLFYAQDDRNKIGHGTHNVVYINKEDKLVFTIPISSVTKQNVIPYTEPKRVTRIDEECYGENATSRLVRDAAGRPMGYLSTYLERIENYQLNDEQLRQEGVRLYIDVGRIAWDLSAEYNGVLFPMSGGSSLRKVRDFDLATRLLSSTDPVGERERRNSVLDTWMTPYGLCKFHGDFFYGHRKTSPKTTIAIYVMGLFEIAFGATFTRDFMYNAQKNELDIDTYLKKHLNAFMSWQSACFDDRKCLKINFGALSIKAFQTYYHEYRGDLNRDPWEIKPGAGAGAGAGAVAGGYVVYPRQRQVFGRYEDIKKNLEDALDKSAKSTGSFQKKNFLEFALFYLNAKYNETTSEAQKINLLRVVFIYGLRVQTHQRSWFRSRGAEELAKNPPRSYQNDVPHLMGMVCEGLNRHLADERKLIQADITGDNNRMFKGKGAFLRWSEFKGEFDSLLIKFDSVKFGKVLDVAWQKG